ncbi:MAG TPA: PAS domain-containing sensor histidine kinase [Acidimicrobiia bacterium]|jgi:signal transduction histidine kinase|nr:PAS domain-containing sensor histidine kinase [Acidimicrobiia bacterium]
MRDPASRADTIDLTTQERAALVDDLALNLPIGVILATREPYRVVWATHASAEVMGLPYDEILKGPEAWIDRLDPDGAQRVQRHLERVADEPRKVDLDYVIHPVHGGPRRVHVTSTPLFDASGTYSSRLAIIDAVEVPEVRTREHAAKVAFLAELSHEMRTPLSSMLGFAELLTSSTLNEKQHRWATLMQESGAQLVSLLDTALYLARLEDPSGSLMREHVDVDTAVGKALDVLEPLAGERTITLHTDARAGGPVTATGNAQRLHQVLLNVLTNALKFGPEGSTVTVTTSLDGRVAAVDVHDSGPGIDRAQRERIFEPFERLDASRRGVAGTGLGLCVSRALMEAMGGSLDVIETDEPGATFRIALPLTPDRLRLEPVPGAAHGHDPALPSA